MSQEEAEYWSRLWATMRPGSLAPNRNPVRVVIGYAAVLPLTLCGFLNHFHPGDRFAKQAWAAAALLCIPTWTWFCAWARRSPTFPGSR